MLAQPNPYSLPLLLSAAIAAGVAAIAWRRRAAPGARPLALLMLGLGIWAGGYAGQWAASTLDTLVFWQNLTYLGVVMVPATFPAFALQYTRGSARLGWPWLLALAAEPALTLLLFWTSGLVHTGFYLDRLNSYIVIGWERGPWFWVNLIYTYAATLGGTLLLALHALRNPPQRAQAYLVLAGVVLPLAANIYNEFVLSTPLELDLTPLSFIASGIIIAFALFRFHLLELAPIARNLLVENMGDGLLVLDAENRIVDLNPTARRMIAALVEPLGRRVEEVLTAQADLVARYENTPQARSQVELRPGSGNWLDLRIEPILDRQQRLLGRVVVFRDISDQRKIEEELQAANQRLRAQIEQIDSLRAQLEEQVIHDSLTGLHNRRYLDETLPPALAQAGRMSWPLSLVMIDIDHFKLLNDTFGHDAGDRMLQALAGQLSLHVRAGDILCRYGGEEFVLVLPGMGAEAACKRAEEWRLACAEVAVPYDGTSLRVTVSAGVAMFPAVGESKEALLRAADQALYEAKAGGRNQVVLWGK
jgi:diguanylate cyclase (GGDEF)-like protein/PAS domain S-box-containing protein